MLLLADARLTLAPLTNFDIGALCSGAIVFVALRAGTLTAGGALAAFFVGALTFGALGPPGAFVLIAFFVTSVLLSRLGRSRKRGSGDIAKAGPRDGAQVLANGGIATVCALLTLTGEARYAVAFAGAFAAANADTWGTELGMLARATPRSILTFRPVAPGISGGVTLVGTVAEVLGAGLIAAVAALSGVAAAWPIFAGGVAGALIDSVLGASLQSLRWCPQCHRVCETDPHRCGANTTLVRGASWIGNDAVNTAATAVGALVAFALVRWR
ncbi:MAG: DUF92 domain-containing protein [Candidatus Eremiobacteraeota bacterium]|nr:DUF92 domain-containing protein [Candidatus Eremiobacteraeota bacterium]